MDAPTAKAAARNVKQRLNALGHDISLNHAYEAVAASLGHPTWAVMKARFDSLSTAPTPATMKSFMPGSLRWNSFALSESNPTALFFGPSGERRDVAVNILVDDWLASQDAALPSFIRVISFKPLRADDSVTHGKHGRISMKSSDLSIFDLPLGQRYPSPDHRLRIIDFVLAGVVAFADLGCPADGVLEALAEPLPRIVDLAYDMRAKKSPNFYAKDVLPELDGVADNANYRFDEEPLTWWQVAHASMAASRPDLAVRAQAQAVPTMGDLLFACRHADMGGVLPGGTRVTDIVARALSRQMREMGGLRGPRRPAAPSALEIIEIEEAADARINRLMMMTALNHCRMLSEMSFSDQAKYKPEWLPRQGAPIRLLVSLPDESIHCDVELKQAFDDAVSAGREVAVFVGDRHFDAPRLLDISSSYFVYGCASHCEVGAVGELFGLDKSEMDLVHDHMVGPYSACVGGVPMLAFRRKFHMTDRSAILMGR